MNRLRIAAVFLSGILVAAAAVGVYAVANSGGGSSDANVQNVATATAAASSTIGSSNASLVSGDCMTAADIYDAVRPSVVEINVSGTQSGQFGSQQFSGTGTGIVLDDKGHILTNNHVIDSASQITVKFDDGATIPATVLGADPGNDVAVITVDPLQHALKAATLADSSKLRVGDPVLALGNPFELEASLTEGIVSGLDRSYSEGGQGSRPIRGLIQTDAAINPGNSGGPLLDCHGQVVGINTLLDNPTGQSVNVGVGFAVAINTAKHELDSLEASQTVQHARLGIAGVDVTPTLAQDLNLNVQRGVYVTVVAAGGPAESAGIKGAFASQSAADASTSSEPPAGGDVIVSVDGTNVTGIEQLATYLDQNKKTGDTVRLGVVRDGKSMDITATLANWPSA
jgi:S1-C subfamily serine protease